MTVSRREFMWLTAGAGASLAGLRSTLGDTLVELDDFPDPAKGIAEGWTTVVFPDTQNYAKFAKNQPMFELMTRWVAEHIEPWKIGLGLHVGDLVEQNDIAEGGGRGWGDQNGADQWASAKRALAVLDGVIPVIIATGNHDYGERNAEDRRTRFNSHFGLTDNPLVATGHGDGIWIESAPNSFGARTLENAAYVIQVPHGPPWLVIALEWGPRKAVVDWASALLARSEFASHRAVLLVHSYLNDDDRRCGDRKRSGNAHRYPTGAGGDTHDGEDLWKALVQPAARLEFVVCGHVMGRHVGYRHDSNKVGRTVHQMLFNAQGLGGGSDERGNGGDGWLRLLTLRPDGHTLDIRTFSPHLLAKGEDPWRRGIDHSFSLGFDPV